MPAPSPAGPAVGPCARKWLSRGKWRVALTRRGKWLVRAFLVRFPRPVGLLKRAWPSLYAGAVAAGLSEDEVAAACLEGVVWAAVRFVPRRGSRPARFVTVVAWGLRGAVGDLLRRHARHAREVPTPFRVGRGGGRGVPAEPARCDAEPAEPDPRLAAALALLDDREREVVRLRYAGGLTLAACAARLGVSYELVRLTQVRALARLRAGLAE